jgi:hypothetical protein
MPNRRQRELFEWACRKLYGIDWRGRMSIYGKSILQEAIEDAKLLKEMAIKNMSGSK